MRTKITLDLEKSKYLYLLVLSEPPLPSKWTGAISQGLYKFSLEYFLRRYYVYVYLASSVCNVWRPSAGRDTRASHLTLLSEFRRRVSSWENNWIYAAVAPTWIVRMNVDICSHSDDLRTTQTDENPTDLNFIGPCRTLVRGHAW